MRLIANILYGLYAAVLFTCVSFLAMLGMLVLPGLSRRRWLARNAARTLASDRTLHEQMIMRRSPHPRNRINPRPA